MTRASRRPTRPTPWGPASTSAWSTGPRRPPGSPTGLESVIAAAGPGNSLAAPAGSTTTIDIDAGAVDRPWPVRGPARRESARRPGRLPRQLPLRRPAAQAERDLTALLLLAPERADQILARRALARLTLGWLEGAEEDAAGATAAGRAPAANGSGSGPCSPCTGFNELSWLNPPDDLPPPARRGPSLKTDLRGPPSVSLAVVGGASGAASARIHRTPPRAVPPG